jgi:hypothetical protein
MMQGWFVFQLFNWFQLIFLWFFPISFRWIWNMFHFIVPENKIMICCFKKRYVSKLCFRKSETCFHQMNNTMFHETLKDGLQNPCCSCSSSNHDFVFWNNEMKHVPDSPKWNAPLVSSEYPYYSETCLNWTLNKLKSCMLSDLKYTLLPIIANPGRQDFAAFS